MAEKKHEADWTIMVYLAGDNNLTDASVYAMTEMKRVTPGVGVNIITQFDPKDDYLPTHRYHIGSTDQPDNIGPLSRDIIGTSKNGGFSDESTFARNHERVRLRALETGRQAALAEAQLLSIEETEKLVQAASQNGKARGPWPLGTTLETILIEPETRPIRSNETDTGSPVTLYNFMSLCVERFAAKHYAVILCGHGSGTAMDFLLKDDSPAGSLTMSELKSAFQQLSTEIGGKPIEILGFDTCLMSMAEVAFELQGLVKFMVSSESYSPLSGWPYRQIMDTLKTMVAAAREDPALEADIDSRLATSIVDEYVNFYADYSLGGLSVDQAALNVEAAGKLRERINGFADALAVELENGDQKFRDDLILAHWEAQSYNGELFVDLVDFCDCLLKRQNTGDVFRLGTQLREFITQHFVLKSCYSGPVYQYSYGVSIYFPWSRIDNEYHNLTFAQEQAGWIRFLDLYTNLTRRAPRDTTPESLFFRRNREVDAIRFRNTQGRGPVGQNPIHSMRNPPVFAEPEECIRERNELRQGLIQILALDE